MIDGRGRSLIPGPKIEAAALRPYYGVLCFGLRQGQAEAAKPALAASTTSKYLGRYLPPTPVSSVNYTHNHPRP
jgi:hypothetical protein